MQIRTWLVGGCLMGAAALASTGCAPQPEEGGANANDRSNGGQQGEALLTGAMSVSPDGRFAIVQRNQTTVLLDVEARTTRELPSQVERFVFAKTRPLAFAVLPQGAGVTAYELPSLDVLWQAEPPLGGAATLARLSDDDTHLVLGDATDVLVLAADTGEVRGTVPIGTRPDQLTFSSTNGHAIVAGTVVWREHQPSTRVVDIDLATLETAGIDVPNCNAPLALLPDGSRAFMSPTFCEEGRSDDDADWTNPDPVSVIDFGPTGPVFVKNLPGFGPVAIDPAATRVVAYLDVERMDESMFDDPRDIPSRSGKRFHIMTIDPRTLDYELSPVGDVLPRFAMTADGRRLLVDATVQQLRGSARLTANLDANGDVVVALEVFGEVDSLFGTFDLETKRYVAFTGRAPLDRFVQMGDGQRVFTLVTRADGMGGDLSRVDLDLHSVTPLDRSLRDIGLLSDKQTLLLRERLPAAQVVTETTTDWYRRERYCFSLDGLTCVQEVVFQDSTPFQSGPTCTDYHDC